MNNRYFYRVFVNGEFLDDFDNEDTAIATGKKSNGAFVEVDRYERFHLPGTFPAHRGTIATYSHGRKIKTQGGDDD